MYIMNCYSYENLKRLNSNHKVVVQKLKEYFYHASIEFVQRAILNEDRIYISWE